MYLRALIIQGFKSFPDKTTLTFDEDITAIVGPNGSGKSNIADAVRWVMGEQSTRTLRGNKMEDVIFDGTAKRKGLGFAEVSLVLDNTGGLFPGLEESEVMVTRRYYRSGESEYYINRSSCRLKDINELFMDTGLGREGYSIIGQGKIDEILSPRSSERREIFEEAAGISRFRHRKEEAEHRLERTEENLVRVNDKIDELELQVGPLRVQAEKTKKFLVLRDELKGLEISVWLESLERVRANLIKAQTDYENAGRQRDEARTELEKLYAAAEDYAAKMREKDMEADRIRFELSKLEADSHESEKRLELLKNDRKNNSANAQRIRDELEQQEGRAGSLAAQIAERRERLAGIEAEMESLGGRLTELNGQSAETVRSAGQLRGELEKLREKENVENASASEAKALLSALAAAAQELIDREETLRRERMALEEKLSEANGVVSDLCAQRDKAAGERDSVKNVLGGYELRAQSRRRKAEAAQENLRRLQMDENNLTSRIKMLTELEKSYEGYNKAVKLVMNEAGRGALGGIRGPVAGLLHVPDRYAVAIETALGGAMQNIVTDTDEDGKNAINLLKRRDGGRATFLPVNTVRPAEFREKGVEDEPGFVGMGDRLIQFEPAYANIFSNLLGRVVIAEGMDDALAIARKYGHRFRIVTLDGQVLNAGGSMTGGSVSRSAGILSRANELERLNTQREALDSQMKEAEKTAAEAQRERTSAEYDFDVARGQLQEAETALLKLNERVQSAQFNARGIAADLEDTKQELGRFSARVAENQRDTEQAKARITELEGAAAALRAESEAKAQGQSALQETLDAINGEIASVNAKLAGLDGERAASEKGLEELESLRRDLTGDRTQRLEAIAQFEAQNEELDRRILEEEEKLQALRGGGADQNERIRRLNEEKLALEGERNKADRASREKNEELLNMERSVSLLEQKKISASLEEKQLLDKLWETYELSHEAAKALRVELESVPKATRRIGELKREISALGSINPDAVEEFNRVNERYTYFTGQRDDVEKSRKELQGIIANITKEMTEIFAAQFNLINEAFQQTFVELFRGGQARLELEDENDILNCGIEIRVQPPGKALKVITLLSGGEKAFVAIALYFAILKVRPTPFCIMDEIEAALDDPNVTRYAQYLRKMSDKTQFIVITHRRGTMEEADVLYGVTMQEQGVSRVLTINLNDVEKELKLRS